jgi:PAS domain S-box-containing protein
LVVGVILLLRTAISVASIYKFQILIIVIGAILPFIGNIIYIFKINPIPGLDWTPIVFGLSGLFLAWGILGFQLLKIVPLARHTLIETTDIGILVVDSSGVILDYNPAMQVITGITPKEAIGRKVIKVLASWEEFIRYYKVQTSITTKIPQTKQGTKYWYNMQITAIKDRHNHFAGQIIVLNDITDHIKVEDKLKLLSSIVEQTSEGVALADLNGIIDFVNDAWCKMHGYKDQKYLIGKNLKIFHSKKQLEDDVIPFNKKVIKNGTFSGEVGHIKKDGKSFPTLMTSTLIKNDEGSAIGIAGMATDITERKRVKQEMQKLSTVVKYSSELVNLATLDGKMTFINEYGGKMLGIEPHEVENVNIMEVIPDHLKELVEKELLPSLMNEGIWMGDLQYRNIKTGELTDVHAMTFSIKDPETGEPEFLANVSLDITERKKAEKELNKYKQHLEEMVEKRTNELELANKKLDESLKVFVGREQTIIRLQQKIQELKRK